MSRGYEQRIRVRFATEDRGLFNAVISHAERIKARTLATELLAFLLTPAGVVVERRAL